MLWRNNMRNLRTTSIYSHTHTYSLTVKNHPTTPPVKAVQNRRKSQAMPFYSLISKEHQHKEPSREATTDAVLENCFAFKSRIVPILKDDQTKDSLFPQARGPPEGEFRDFLQSLPSRQSPLTSAQDCNPWIQFASLFLPSSIIVLLLKGLLPPGNSRSREISPQH